MGLDNVWRLSTAQVSFRCFSWGRCRVEFTFRRTDPCSPAGLSRLGIFDRWMSLLRSWVRTITVLAPRLHAIATELDRGLPLFPWPACFRHL